MRVFECVCTRKFKDKIILRGGECKTRENLKFNFFLKKNKKKKGDKMVIYWNSPEKSWNFSRSRMTKWIAPLESSHEI